MMNGKLTSTTADHLAQRDGRQRETRSTISLESDKQEAGISFCKNPNQHGTICVRDYACDGCPRSGHRW